MSSPCAIGVSERIGEQSGVGGQSFANYKVRELSRRPELAIYPNWAPKIVIYMTFWQAQSQHRPESYIKPHKIPQQTSVCPAHRYDDSGNASLKPTTPGTALWENPGTTTGRLAVLDNIRSAVAYYDSGPELIEEDALRPPCSASPHSELSLAHSVNKKQRSTLLKVEPKTSKYRKGKPSRNATCRGNLFQPILSTGEEEGICKKNSFCVSTIKQTVRDPLAHGVLYPSLLIFHLLSQDVNAEHRTLAGEDSQSTQFLQAQLQTNKASIQIYQGTLVELDHRQTHRKNHRCQTRQALRTRKPVRIQILRPYLRCRINRYQTKYQNQSSQS
ncbi:hypothetical protein B0H16DRAFT_1697853 [Mycena metata]|uniref:Uncharacterized protein n=1 Tax=Mycena metata TaxID=1033252 RepID=A0AAD7MQ69_9AGAR|nr:hypothetical protein B0H16DRAFT_1697853 [Mycena metata]